MYIPQKSLYLNILGVGLHEVVSLSTFSCGRDVMFLPRASSTQAL